MLFIDLGLVQQVLYSFRKSNATVKAAYTYVDTNDDFEREPYVVHFHVPQAGQNITISCKNCTLFIPHSYFLFILCFYANEVILMVYYDSKMHQMDHA